MALKKFIAATTLILTTACAVVDDGTGSDGYPFGLLTEQTGKAEAVGIPPYGDELGQSFIAGASMAVAYVNLKLYTLGYPTGSLVLSIQADQTNGSGNSIDLPDGTDLGTSTVTMSTTTIPATGAAVAFVFTPTITLTAGSKYWLRLKATYGTGNSSNHVKWAGNDSNAYPYGHAIYETSTTNIWDTTLIGSNRDFLFQVVPTE